MAKTNYNKMSKKNNLEDTPVVETGSLDIEQITVEVDTTVEKVVDATPEKVENTVKYGVVVNCEKLNVRNNPHPNAYIELVIPKGTEVEITDSNGDFYFVRKGTVSEGFSGWCMKKYISVK